MLKESRLIKKKRTTRGGGKKDRTEWALVSKANGRVLKWFGPTKPSKDQVAKEERRVHSFADDVSIYMEKTSGVKLEDDDDLDDTTANIRRYWAAMAEIHDTYSQLAKWNTEFIEGYAPGTTNAKAIIPLMTNFTIPDELSDKSKEEKYKWFYENSMASPGSMLRLKLPTQNGFMNFKWEPGILDSHGMSGFFDRSNMIVAFDPAYWFPLYNPVRGSAKEGWNAQRELVFHELNHVVSWMLAILATGTGTNITEEEPADLIRPELEHAQGPFKGEWTQHPGSLLSNKPGQKEHYNAMFNQTHIPEWWIELASHTGRAAEGGEWENDGVPIINFKWTNQRAEQRSILKTFLSTRGGKMTMEIWTELCNKRQEAKSFDWGGTSVDQKFAYLKGFEKNNGLMFSALLFLKCPPTQDLLDHANAIALAPLPQRSDQTTRTASISKRLFILSKSLFKQGLKKEAEQVRLLIK